MCFGSQVRILVLNSLSHSKSICFDCIVFLQSHLSDEHLQAQVQALLRHSKQDLAIRMYTNSYIYESVYVRTLYCYY